MMMRDKTLRLRYTVFGIARFAELSPGMGVRAPRMRKLGGGFFMRLLQDD